MAKAQSIDFANMAALSVQESALNTLTFKKLDAQISINEKIAWLINRLEIFVDISAGQLNATGDAISVALTRSNLVTNLLDMTEGSILWNAFMQRQDFGAAATMILLQEPFTWDFSTFPGGGLITPPTPLYGAVKGTGCVAANLVQIRLWYQTLELTPEQYWQLVESVRIIA